MWEHADRLREKDEPRDRYIVDGVERIRYCDDLGVW